MNREEYMNHPCHMVGATQEERMRVHREYYAQFVSQHSINAVAQRIGHDAIMASTDRHFNDIPMCHWDKANTWLPIATTFKSMGDFASLSGYVCIAKEAARQYKESQESI